MEAVKINKYTVDEYLELEATSEVKHEYYDGEIFAMSGGTFNHSLIGNNMGACLRDVTKGKNCTALNSDLKVALDFAKSFVYPDATVVCGNPEFSPNDKNALTNPVLIVEVLSKATWGYDRGGKFWKYKHLSSFKEYVLIEQNVPVVEVSSRLADGSWKTVSTLGLEHSIYLHSLDCSVSMKEIYAGVSGLEKPSLRLFKE